MLTETQQGALQQAIFDYLLSQKLDEVASSLASSLPSINVPEPGTPPPPGGPTLLEKKWSSVLRLQKKVLDLEATLKKNGPSSSSSSSTSQAVSGRSLPSSTPPPRPCKGHRGGGVNSLAVHPSHNTVASAGSDATVKIWDWESAEFLQTLKGHTAAVQDVCYSGSGALLASCAADLAIKMWDVEKGYECVRTLRGHEHNVSRVRFLPPNDTQLLSCSRDSTIKFWEVTTGFCTHTITSSSWVRALAVRCDGLQLACGGNDPNIVVYSADVKREEQTLRGHEHVVNSVAYPPLPAGKAQQDADVANLLVSASRDKTVRLWNTSTGANLHTFSDHDNWVRDVFVHRSRDYVVSVSDDRSLVVWDVKNKRRLRKIEDAHGHFVTCASMHPVRPILATGGVDNVVSFWSCK